MSSLLTKEQNHCSFQQKSRTCQTDELCSTLEAGLATCWILEQEDQRKAKSNYLSAKGGRFSWAEVSDAEKEVCMGMKVVNEPSLAVFYTFTEALSTASRAGLESAAGQGQAR